MERNNYKEQKNKYAYNLYKNHKFFKKARAIVYSKDKIYLIKETSENKKPYYLLPGGGVDEGESARQAAVRETLEEYGIKAKNAQYVGRHYYSCDMEYLGEKFKSNRVEYYYLCEADLSQNIGLNFGLEGEFENDKNTYEKITISLEEFFNTDPKILNKMSNNIFDKIVILLKQKCK